MAATMGTRDSNLNNPSERTGFFTWIKKWWAKNVANQMNMENTSSFLAGEGWKECQQRVQLQTIDVNKLVIFLHLGLPHYMTRILYIYIYIYIYIYSLVGGLEHFLFFHIL